MTRNYPRALLAVAILLLGAPALAGEANVTAEPEFSPSISERVLYPTFDRPGMVQVYAVECSAVGGIKFRIRDCCMAGDRWEVLGKLADQKPATAMITGNGSITGWRMTTIDGRNSAPLRGMLQVRYCHGVNVFPASATLDVFCSNPNAKLDITDLGQFPDISK